MKTTVLLFVIMFLSGTQTVLAQEFWQSTNGPNKGGVWSLAVDGQERIYALTDSGLYRSTDDGQNWTPLNVASRGDGFGLSVAVAPSGDVFASDSAGMGVWHSTDNGDTWTHRASNFWAPTDMVFHPSGSIFYKAWTGIYRSTDSGMSWDSVNGIGGQCIETDLAGNIYAIQKASPPDNIDRCYRSTDNGNFWVWTGSPNVGVFLSEYFDLIITPSGQLLYAASCFGSGLYASTDAGVSWSRKQIVEYGHVETPALAMNSSGGIFCGGCGVRGGVIMSTDDATTWSILNAGLADTCVYSLAISPSGHIYAGTMSGTVFRSVNPTTSIDDRSSKVPETFLLQQNYPNPFNPTTSILFELPVRAHVTLKVSDLLGREVATLINEPLEPGVKSIEFAPRNLSSGVYFYQVRAGAFVATKKMILMR
jgi:photosystem II stability/assembly factor-like uncharacterized protein